MKVKWRDSRPSVSEKDLLAEWKDYFSSLLSNDSGLAPSEIPPQADEYLFICTEPPTREKNPAKTIAAMKVNKAAALDCTITAEALKGGGDQMIDAIRGLFSQICIPHSLHHANGPPMSSSLCKGKVTVPWWRTTMAYHSWRPLAANCTTKSV